MSEPKVAKKVKVKAVYDLSAGDGTVFLWGIEFTKTQEGFFADLDKEEADALIEAGRAVEA